MRDNDIVSKINNQKSNSPARNSQLSYTQHAVSCDRSGKNVQGFWVDLDTIGSAPGWATNPSSGDVSYR